MNFIIPAQFETKTVARKIISIFERMDRGESFAWCVVYNLFTGKFRILEDKDERNNNEIWVVVDCDTWDLYEDVFRGWKRSYADMIEKTVNLIYYNLAVYLDWDCYFELDDDLRDEPKRCIRLCRQMIEELNKKDCQIVGGYVKIEGYAGPLSHCLQCELAC